MTSTLPFSQLCQRVVPVTLTNTEQLKHITGIIALIASVATCHAAQLYEAGDDGFTKNTMSRIEDSSIMGALPLHRSAQSLGGGHH